MKKIVVATGTGLAAIALGGVAFAAWSSSATASSSAANSGKHSAASAPTVTVDASALTGLYPTWSGSKNLTVTVANPNPYRVVIDSVNALSVSSTGACATDLASLATSPFTFGAPTSGIGSAIAANPGTPASANVVIPLTAVSNTLPDSCQNAAVVVSATATVSSN